jgi:hypothetical protein
MYKKISHWTELQTARLQIKQGKDPFKFCFRPVQNTDLLVRFYVGILFGQITGALLVIHLHHRSCGWRCSCFLASVCRGYPSLGWSSAFSLRKEKNNKERRRKDVKRMETNNTSFAIQYQSVTPIKEILVLLWQYNMIFLSIKWQIRLRIKHN